MSLILFLIEKASLIGTYFGFLPLVLFVAVKIKSISSREKYSIKDFASEMFGDTNRSTDRSVFTLMKFFFVSSFIATVLLLFLADYIELSFKEIALRFIVITFALIITYSSEFEK